MASLADKMAQAGYQPQAGPLASQMAKAGYTPATNPAPASDPNALETSSSPLSNLWANLKKVPGQATNFLSTVLPGKELGTAIGRSTYSAGQAIGQLARGDIRGARQTAIAQEQENNANFGKIVGDTVQAVAAPASLAIGGPAGAGAKAALTRVGVNTGLGAILGGSNAASKGGSVSDIAKEAALGGAAGGLLSGAAEGVSAAKSKLLDRARAVDNLEQTYIDLAGGTKAGKVRLDKAGAVTAAKNAAGTQGKTSERVLAEAGIIPKQSGTKLDTFQQAQDFRKAIEPLRSANRAALKEVQMATEPVRLADIEKGALARANTAENIDSGKAPGLVKEIKQSFAELRAAYGDTVNLTKLDDIKSARWGRAPFDSTRPLQSDANYLIAKTAQKTIEDTARKAGFNDVAQLNRVIGDQLEASTFLEKLNGQTVKGLGLGKYVLMGIGASAGKSLPGKVLGALGGDAIANILISTSVAGPAKRLILKDLATKDPEAYTQTLRWLEQQGLLRDLRLKLPPGQTIFMPARSTPPNTSGVIQGTEGPKPQFNPKIALPPGKPLAGINQGRPVKVLPSGNIDYIGRDAAAQMSVLPKARSINTAIQTAPKVPNNANIRNILP